MGKEGKLVANSHVFLCLILRLEETGRIFMAEEIKENVQSVKKKKPSISNTKRVVGTAVFTALAYVTSFLEFPIFPAAPFLKLDFSAVFILLAGFIFGPLFGVMTCAVKEFLNFITKSSTGGVGEIANFIVISGYVLIPTIVYCYKKGFLTVITTLVIACVVQVALSLLANRFITFPLYMGAQAVEIFNSLWHFVLLFNLIKAIAISIVSVLLYKRLSGLIKRI